MSASFSNLRVLASPGEVVSVQLSAGGGGVPPLVANVTVMSCGVGQGMISGSTTCQVCGAGYTSNGAACQACPRGTVASVAGSPACSACEAGKYAAEPGLAVCEICPGGVWGIGASISANCSGQCLEGYCTFSRCSFTPPHGSVLTLQVCRAVCDCGLCGRPQIVRLAAQQSLHGTAAACRCTVPPAAPRRVAWASGTSAHRSTATRHGEPGVSSARRVTTAAGMGSPPRVHRVPTAACSAWAAWHALASVLRVDTAVQGRRMRTAAALVWRDRTALVAVHHPTRTHVQRVGTAVQALTAPPAMARVPLATSAAREASRRRQPPASASRHLSSVQQAPAAPCLRLLGTIPSRANQGVRQSTTAHRRRVRWVTTAGVVYCRSALLEDTATPRASRH